jgi:hypothetical protein
MLGDNATMPASATMPLAHRTPAASAFDFSLLTAITKRLGLVLPLAIVVSFAPFWWTYTIDDSYISLRYAHNLATGNGPVFTPGERVEGVSTQGWVMFLAAIEKLGLDPVRAAKSTGLLAALGLVALLYFVTLSVTRDRVVASLAAVWLAVLPGIHVYASSGMETMVFALAIACAVSLPEWNTSTIVRVALLYACLLAVAVLRPEGLLIFGVLSLLWFIWPSGGAERIAVMLSWATVAGLLLLRHRYYGEFLPNTYLAKPSELAFLLRSQPLPSALLGVLYRVLSYDAVRGSLDRLGGTGLLFCAAAGVMLRTRSRTIVSCGAVVLGGAAFLSYAPIDWMPADRFALPFAFPLLLSAAAGLQALRTSTRADQSRAVSLVLAVIVAAWAAVELRETASLLHDLRAGIANPAIDSRPYAAIGRWLNRNGRPGDSLLAFEVGAVGYFSGLRIIDHEGLLTRPVAQIIQRAGGYWRVRDGQNRQAMNDVVQYCVRQNPDWMMINSHQPIALGARGSDVVAVEPIQRALVRSIGADMTVAAVFNIRPGSQLASDTYVLLHRSR